MNARSTSPAAWRHEMNNRPGRRPGARPPWPRRARVAAAIAATACLTLLATACGGSPSSTASGGSPNTEGTANASSAIAYSRCMRSHGLPDFPDPDSSGQISKEAILQLGVTGSVLQRAQQACQSLWPYQAPTQAQQRQQLTDDLRFAQCMRSHGLPDFPDPTTTSGGQVEFVLSISRDGFNPQSQQILAKARECQHVLPAGSPLPHATVAP